MVDYGLKDRVALITGANNPQGIGATTAFAFAREGAKVVLVYKFPGQCWKCRCRRKQDSGNGC